MSLRHAESAARHGSRGADSACETAREAIEPDFSEVIHGANAFNVRDFTSLPRCLKSGCHPLASQKRYRLCSGNLAESVSRGRRSACPWKPIAPSSLSADRQHSVSLGNTNFEATTPARWHSSRGNAPHFLLSPPICSAFRNPPEGRRCHPAIFDTRSCPTE